MSAGAVRRRNALQEFTKHDRANMGRKASAGPVTRCAAVRPSILQFALTGSVSPYNFTLEHSGGGMVDEENLIEENLLEFYELRKGNEDLEESNRRHKLMSEELAAKKQEILFSTLHDDVIHSLIELKKTDTQFMRRTYIRALFAFIEGCTYMIKQEVFIHQKYKREPNLTPEEMILLKEETPT